MSEKPFVSFFFQINSLIAQLADANRDTLDQQNSTSLLNENKALKSQIDDILVIQSQLNTDVHHLQEELRRKETELGNAQDESKRLRFLIDSEKSRLQNILEETQRELQMKSAALQSLMLVKQVNNLGFKSGVLL
ncbi:unnamed protein product [Gongylonema pulchrum]|uniref:Golgin subfamily A conserved domain-containing protein n=1 Tax=Gongylonema pulchrum TaxID=637853 RepID=A0A183DH89_9BILA|nr:unnamed protein product [Gongylonema pulchrum]